MTSLKSRLAIINMMKHADSNISRISRLLNHFGKSEKKQKAFDAEAISKAEAKRLRKQQKRIKEMASVA